MKPPTIEELLNEDLEQVSHIITEWRHGYNVEDVVFRNEDKTHWRVTYQVDTDGEYNGLRDGQAIIVKVTPVTVYKTEYKMVKQ
jgi:hypothetical protein